MAWRLQYYGEFLDVKGTAWRCEILRDTDTPLTSSEVTFPASEPLRIEWPSLNFEDVVWGSSATLRLVSDSDRRFIDLYTITPGTIRLDVYRAGSLYWSGLLDPEFYEEPYERLQGYEVELTFTDFGILDRLKYDLDGPRTLDGIIAYCIEKSGVNCSGTDTRAVSISLPDGGRAVGSGAVSVRSENFTDEEGERSTLREALEGILQPLCVKIAQREGRILLFDMEGLVELYGPDPYEDDPVRWTGDTQTLGVDRVYNSVTVTFSPYARAEWLSDCLSYDSAYDVTWYDLTNDNTGPHNGGATCYTYYPDYGGYGTGDWDYTDLDFTIFTGEGSGVTLGGTGTSGNAGFFHILPVYGNAAECSGVYYMFYTGGHSSLATHAGCRRIGVQYPSGGMNAQLITLPRISVPAIPDEDSRATWLLRLVQEVMLDCRYNPFNSADDNNEKGNQGTLEDNSAFVFIRAHVRLYDSESGGTCLWHYDNSAVAKGSGTDRVSFGEWKEGAGSNDVWLEYYNPDDLTDNAGGAGGWNANRHCVGKPDGKGGRNKYGQCNSMLRNATDGEFVPYPPEGGWLEVAVYSSVYGYQHGGSEVPGDSDRWTDKGLYDVLRWWLYKCPEVSVVRNSLLFDDADLEDVEYRGTLNADAADDLSIDTVCGTCDDAPPTARGLYYVTETGGQVSEMCRGAVTARPEQLLIGALYTQYAGRKTTLTGEGETPSRLLTTEQNQGDTLFVLTADSQDIRMAVSDIELREVGTDTYREEETDG